MTLSISLNYCDCLSECVRENQDEINWNFVLLLSVGKHMIIAATRHFVFLILLKNVKHNNDILISILLEKLES